MSVKPIVLLFVAAVAALFASVDANGASCQLYGHSCLGGHGKRSDSSVDLTADSLQSRVAGQQRMNNLLQRMMSRRLAPDLLAAYMASASSSGELSDMDKRTADYLQS